MRDLAVNVAREKGMLTTETDAPNLYTHQDDTRLRFEYRGGKSTLATRGWHLM
jgi:hypothetical protein